MFNWILEITPILYSLGVLVIVSGQVLRTLAMWTASVHFSHQIRTERVQQHRLITTGIYRQVQFQTNDLLSTERTNYSHLRHPSYTGFILFALGTQILLQNAISFFLFCFMLRAFFQDRVEHEESLLIAFFGNDYRNYMKRTWRGIL